MSTRIFTEQLDLAEVQLDAEARILRDVTLIRSGMSANRRYYSEDVLGRAVNVFEGAKAYADHPDRVGAARSVRDLTGWYANVRFDGKRLLADRHFANTQAGQDIWAVASEIVRGHAPRSLAGLSINAVGTGQEKDFDDGSGIEVTDISAANSVDDVSTPAAGGGYLMMGNGDELTSALLGAMTFEEWRETKPAYVEQLKKEWQTIRQTEAVKAAQAEADQLREALHAAQGATQALETELASLRESSASALTDAAAARRELAVERALKRVKLPADWEASLRARLLEADPDEWVAIIEDEQGKARHIPRKRPHVTGADAHVTPPLAAVTEGWSPVPMDGEDVEMWVKRTKGR